MPTSKVPLSTASPASLDRRHFLQVLAASSVALSLPAPARSSKATTDTRTLQDLARQGLTSRLATSRLPGIYQARLEHELQVIAHLDLSRRFLQWHELATWARNQSIPLFAGLGQASSSLVCWSLGLSELDPIEHGLVFERFLNWRRANQHGSNAPFFQLLVAESRHHDLFDHLLALHPKHHVALASLARNPVSDLLHVVEQVLVPHKTMTWSHNTLSSCGPGAASSRQPPFKAVRNFLPAFHTPSTWRPVTELLSSSAELRAATARHRSTAEVLELALELEPNTALHLGPDSLPGTAIVLSSGGDLPGLGNALLNGNSYRATSLTARQAEAAGHTVLWVSPLASLDELAGLVAPHAASADDRVWDSIASGKARAVGLESHMTSLVQAAAPRSPDELAALFALARPFPIEAGWTGRYLAKKHRAPQPALPGSAIELHLPGTRGELLYHEQAIELAVSTSGMSAAQADLMLRSLLKGNISDADRWRRRFASRATALGRPPAHGAEVFALIEDRSLGMFSHSFALGCAVLVTRILAT